MIYTIDLGWCIGKLDTERHKLTIVSPSDRSENLFQPAESVHVWHKSALIELRDALNKAYPDV